MYQGNMNTPNQMSWNGPLPFTNPAPGPTLRVTEVRSFVISAQNPHQQQFQQAILPMPQATLPSVRTNHYINPNQNNMLGQPSTSAGQSNMPWGNLPPPSYENSTNNSNSNNNFNGVNNIQLAIHARTITDNMNINRSAEVPSLQSRIKVRTMNSLNSANMEEITGQISGNNIASQDFPLITGDETFEDILNEPSTSNQPSTSNEPNTSLTNEISTLAKYMATYLPPENANNSKQGQQTNSSGFHQNTTNATQSSFSSGRIQNSVPLQNVQNMNRNMNMNLPPPGFGPSNTHGVQNKSTNPPAPNPYAQRCTAQGMSQKPPQLPPNVHIYRNNVQNVSVEQNFSPVRTQLQGSTFQNMNTKGVFPNPQAQTSGTQRMPPPTALPPKVQIHRKKKTVGNYSPLPNVLPPYAQVPNNNSTVGNNSQPPNAPRQYQKINKTVGNNFQPPNALPPNVQIHKTNMTVGNNSPPPNAPQPLHTQLYGSNVQSVSISQNSPTPNVSSQIQTPSSNNAVFSNRPVMKTGNNTTPQPKGLESTINLPSTSNSSSLPAMKSPPYVNNNAAPECAASAINARPVITATHRLPMTIQKPSTITRRPSIDLEQSRRSLQASVGANSAMKPSPVVSKASAGKADEASKQTEGLSIQSILQDFLKGTASTSTESGSNKRNDTVAENDKKTDKVAEKENETDKVKEKEKETDKVSVKDKETDKITEKETNKNAEKDKTDKVTEKETDKVAEKDQEKVPEKDKEEEVIITLDEFLIKEITNSSKKLRAMDKTPKKEVVSPVVSPYKSPPISIESSLNPDAYQNDVEIIFIEPGTSKVKSEKKKMNFEDLPNESDLNLPIKKKPGPKSRTMPAYLEEKKRFSETEGSRKSEVPHASQKPELQNLRLNVKEPNEKNPSKKSKTVDLTKNPAERISKNKSNGKTSSQKPEETKEMKKSEEKMKIKKPKDTKKKLEEKKEVKKPEEKQIQKPETKSSTEKKETPVNKIDSDWAEKLKNSASHFVVEDKPPTKKSPTEKKSPEPKKTKSVDSGDEPPAKKAKPTEQATEITRKDQSGNKSSKNKQDETQKKLEALIKFVQDDDISHPNLKRRSSSEEESSRRRKLSRTEVVRNKNMEREKISIVSKDFAQKSASSKQEDKKNPEVKTTPKIGPKCFKEMGIEKTNVKSPEEALKITEADSSILDENEEEKVSDDINNSQSSSIDEDVKPKLPELVRTNDTPSLSPARISSTSEEFDIDSRLRAFQSEDCHRCMLCAKTVGINEFWINIKSSELKCTGCLAGLASKNTCYDSSHEEEIQKLRLEVQALKKENRKLQKRREKKKDSKTEIEDLLKEQKKLWKMWSRDSSDEEK